LTFPGCYLLVFHGSSDPRSQAAAEALTEEFSQKLSYHSQVPQALGVAFDWLGLDSASTAPVSTSVKPLPGEAKPLSRAVYLECHPLPLHEQIKTCLESCWAIAPDLQVPIGCTLLPVFLLQGVHVMEDIPTEMALAQQALGPQVDLTLTPHLGSHPGLRRIITEQMATIPAQTWVLVAHGSRRPGANESLTALATALGATVAYWSMPPDLESCLKELMHQGFTHIGIAPFFLFPGGITDAIASTIHQLSQQVPTVRFTLIDPLGSYPGLADLLLDWIPQKQGRW
jgi:sirohydrochlorin cobaltochelatase